MEYKGYTTEISVEQATALWPSFGATYNILKGRTIVAVGTVASGFKTHEAAQAVAEQSARRWIDEQG